jgi:hypothetical protein
VFSFIIKIQPIFRLLIILIFVITLLRIFTLYSIYKETPTPIESGTLNLMITNPRQAIKTKITEYQLKVSSVTYPASQTHLDIVFLYLVLSRFLYNPSNIYIKAVDQVIGYLKGTRYLAIVYSRSTLK